MTDYYDLGNYSRTISTTSPEVQLWFDRGLIWCYGFNHEESVRCFKKAVAADPDCAIAYWGIAYAAGPNYNKPWETFDATDLTQSLTEAYTATQAALARKDTASDVEQALIHALQHRYPSKTAADNLNLWNDNYANAMRGVYEAYPDDLDVCSLFAEALMNRTPWALWDLQSGKAAKGAHTLEAVTLLEKVLQQIEQTDAAPHPGLLHMYIHLMEMSPHPEQALRASDTLRDLVPDSGHLQHMPTHIDVLCGHYDNVVASNSRAIVADRKFLEREGPLNFYSMYRCHDYHFKLYGAMFLGQYKPALDAANEMVATLSEELLRVETPPMADWTEGFVSMKMHVLIRFGQWQAILDEPLPENQELFCMTTAMMYYAKGVAHATLGNVKAADDEQQLFEATVSRVPDTRYVFNNTCLDILAIAGEMLKGELAYRTGQFNTAFAHLRKSVELDDNLPYDEPWGWMQPTRHALGALLLEQDRVTEAEAVYRADLGLDQTLSRACQHPDNVWSLHGFHECLRRMNKTDEANIIKLRLDIATAHADVPIQASCYWPIRLKI